MNHNAFAVALERVFDLPPGTLPRTRLWRDQDALDRELLDERARDPQPARCGGPDA